jgi:ATP-dependent HslUV protease subunit HslV
MQPLIRSTTILAVRRQNHVVLAADGQVTMKDTVLKHSACKLRELYEGKIIAGFAGATADAFTLFELFEGKLKDYSGNVERAAVELTKEWRTDKMLRRLEALLLVADKEKSYLLSGNGDVIAPEHGAVAIGSGGTVALSAARALLENTDKDAMEIAQIAMNIAGDVCIYTNQKTIFKELKSEA